MNFISFKLYEKDDEIFADFYEAHQSFPLNVKNYKTKVINSLEDFKEKWMDYYNHNSFFPYHFHNHNHNNIHLLI